MKPWHEAIIISNQNTIENYNSLEDVCKARPELILKDITGYTFPFTYKGWDFNKVQYRTKAK